MAAVESSTVAPSGYGADTSKGPVGSCGGIAGTAGAGGSPAPGGGAVRGTRRSGRHRGTGCRPIGGGAPGAGDAHSVVWQGGSRRAPPLDQGIIAPFRHRTPRPPRPRADPRTPRRSAPAAPSAPRCPPAAGTAPPSSGSSGSTAAVPRLARPGCRRGSARSAPPRPPAGRAASTIRGRAASARRPPGRRPRASGVLAVYSIRSALLAVRAQKCRYPAPDGVNGQHRTETARFTGPVPTRRSCSARLRQSPNALARSGPLVLAA